MASSMAFNKLSFLKFYFGRNRERNACVLLCRMAGTKTFEHRTIEGEEFRVLYIPGYTKMPQETKKERSRRREVPPPRYTQMPVSQDWTEVWPTAQTFKWSVMPFPVQQGYVQAEDNDGVPPGRYANVELMKIPNFLHLTPKHIKKHCAVLKDFCTAWPRGLESDVACTKYFPLEVITSDYVFDAASIRDARAKLVSIKVLLSGLQLDHHARDKFVRLVGDRYNKDTDMLTLTSDRCPLKKQNLDYVHYLLTVLYHESWKTEQWETQKTDVDQETYIWEKRHSFKSVMETLQKAVKSKDNNPPVSIDELATRPEVRHYKEAVEQLHNEGEDLQKLDNYKKASKKLLLGV